MASDAKCLAVGKIERASVHTAYMVHLKPSRSLAAQNAAPAVTVKHLKAEPPPLCTVRSLPTPPTHPACPKERMPDLTGFRDHAPAARTIPAATSSRAQLLEPLFSRRTFPLSSFLTIATDRLASSSNRLSGVAVKGPSLTPRRSARMSALDSLQLGYTWFDTATLHGVLEFGQTEAVTNDE